MKLSAFVITLALAFSSSAFAADNSRDDGSATASARATAHRLADDAKLALHKLGLATRHALHRADAALHRDRRDERERNS
ncbi:hypothetical protein GCM10028796_34780 [Ramlibacter monticola]|uniref:DUF4148 domain-containing protein n=1 Tax=Ramlibacter monticola TaxID=1926872 RepID=A0A937CXV7_9BURK|nr:hypothetical protein [Ramlibacter monticola]MBL0395194.1 hypothetical protein [Ramlibacter monticola]